MTQSYPLHWPFGRPRAHNARRSKFKISMWEATQRLLAEIRRLGGVNVVISTNVALRQDGLPYANRSEPGDKGAAAYFQYRRQSMCFACDKWDRVGDNIYAVAMTIEALRGIERWGTGDMVEQAFTGFVALEAPKGPWEILGIPPGSSIDEIDAAWRAKARLLHPDIPGGSADAMAEVNEARRKLKERVA